MTDVQIEFETCEGRKFTKGWISIENAHVVIAEIAEAAQRVDDDLHTFTMTPQPE